MQILKGCHGKALGTSERHKRQSVFACWAVAPAAFEMKDHTFFYREALRLVDCESEPGDEGNLCPREARLLLSRGHWQNGDPRWLIGVNAGPL